MHIANAERDTQILAYGPFVRRIAASTLRSLQATNQGVVTFDDLVSAGTTGLIEAVDRFEPGFGVNFATFAKQRIFGSMMNELRSMDAVTDVQKFKGKRIKTAQVTLRQKLGRLATDEEVAENLEMSIQAYHKMHSESSLAFEVISIDRGTRAEGNAADVSTIAVSAPEPSQEEAMIDRQEKEMLALAVASLSEREQTIVREYYTNELTFRQIGSNVLSIDESRVRKVLKDALTKIRQHMEAQQTGTARAAA